MQKHLNNIAYVISSMGLVGIIPAARVWASLLGLVLLWLSSWLYSWMPVIGLSFLGAVLALCFWFHGMFGVRFPKKGS